MTDTIIDRNEAFAIERRQQIADIRAGRENAVAAAEKVRADFSRRLESGKVRDNGNGTYTVTDPGSWDNGETWTIQQVPEIGALVLPQSNLDESSGEVALYTRHAEWHGLGTVVPEGIADLSEVLRLGKIDFEVIQTPALYQRPGSGIEMTTFTTAEVPDTFVNVRNDTYAALGTVGKVYKPIQNYDAGAFLQDLVNDHGLVFESAGATYGGKHVFIGMRLPDDIELDLGDNVRDTIIPYLYWLNSHDGTTSASVTISPWRVACGNTESFNLRDAVARWRTRHTINAMREDRVAEARRTLGLVVKYFEGFRQEEEALARTDIAVSEFENLLMHIYPKPEDEATDRVKKNWDDKAGVLLGMFGRQAGETGRTAYSAERAWTDYLDHAAPKRVKEDKLAAARATAILEGTDLEVKSRVHAALLTLANR